MTARDGQASPGSAENPLPPVEACRRQVNPKKTKRALLKWLAAAGTGAVVATTTLVPISCAGKPAAMAMSRAAPPAKETPVPGGLAAPPPVKSTATQPVMSAATQPTSEPRMREIPLGGVILPVELRKPGSAPRPAGAVGTTYTVRPGDTLFAIAGRELGDSAAYRKILALNPGLNPKRLQVGQTIQMPLKTPLEKGKTNG